MPRKIEDVVDYQVMVDGKETDITTLTREQAILELAVLIDRLEEVDDVVRKMGQIVQHFRTGRTERELSQ